MGFPSDAYDRTFGLSADHIKRSNDFCKVVFHWGFERWSNPENPNKDYWFIKTNGQK
jgi:hypothetical protein